ncbi:MAG TPA: hypothetical protein VM287_13615 [Egibacteraceae bacterium]|nr:hypothetical protein [Egibacteraceae bacterium]
MGFGSTARRRRSTWLQEQIDEDVAESADAFTWLASGTDVPADAPAGVIFAIAREAEELADVVATTLAPLNSARALALLRRWQGPVDALGQAERSALLLDVRAHVAVSAALHGVAAMLLDETRSAWTVAGEDRRAAEVTDHLGCALR